MYIRGPIEVRFWAKVDKSGDCWIWTGAKNKTGAHRYGFFGVRTKVIDHAHRVAWILTHGPIAAGQAVHHQCGNTLCVNPAHLYLGGTIDRAQTRFWSKVDKTPTCWLWTGPKNPNGYGNFTMGRKRRVLAHRLSYEWAHGPIPDGLSCCHVCDEPSCVRVDHLFLGTTADNLGDMADKGRSCQGEKQHCAKLTAEQVLAIRAQYATGTIGQYRLASLFTVNRRTIQQIVQEKTWRHLLDSAKS
jgi:hypothetical protein